MREKCVLWAKPVLATLIVILGIAFTYSDATLTAQSTDPLALPRLAFADLIYQGAFRMPRAAMGNDDFGYGGLHLAYNPAHNSLFSSSLHNNVAEVTIPAPVNTANISQLPFASYLQGFSDPSEGHFREIEAGGPNGAVMAGLMVHGDRLYVTGSIYYDAMNTQVVSHFAHSTTLSTPSFSGMSQVWETGKAGYVGGYMTNVPSEWQSLLGGPGLTGQCCIPIVGRTSFGPAAFGFDPTRVGANSAVPASPLLYYTNEHATLGQWASSNERYGATVLMGGVAVISGTRTALFVGRNGLGTYCYGHGVTDPALNNTLASDGVTNCYDPASADKGMHAYPYRYQIWAYDLADFAAVKAGTKQPWDVVPYAVWPFELPMPESGVRIGGVAYDAQRQLLYLAQFRADHDGYADRPLIHVLKVNAPSSTAPPPPPTTDPYMLKPAAQEVSSPVSTSTSPVSTATASVASVTAAVASVALSTSIAAPQPAGSTIVWTATPSDTTSPNVYKWFVSPDGGTWNAVGSWTSSNQFSWTPTAAGANYHVSAWVKRASNTADAAEASAERSFAITEAVSTPVSNVALTANLAAPQPAGTPIVWSAAASGGTGALVYKWFISPDGGTWNAVGSWTPSNQFTWTPTTAGANYRISAWVKRASNPADAAEASANVPFAITEASRPVTDVVLSTNVAAPQMAGSTIIWTATPSGGTGALVYKWFVSPDGGTWNPVGSWTSSNQFTWTPAIAGNDYRVSAWVKRASNTADAAEASANNPFPITEPSRPVATVVLTTDLPAPQETSSTIVWTATAAGGTGALVYKWFVSEDGGTWNPAGSWTASNQFTWTPTIASANYHVSAWVKRASNPADAAEASSEQSFPIQQPIASVALTTNLASPQPLSSTIEWTATPFGGTGTLLFKWFFSSDDGATWTAAGPWGTSNRLSWAPTAANPKYRVTVWVKHATNPSDLPEASNQRRFTIK